METDQYLEKTLTKLEALYHEMQQAIDKPEFLRDPRHPRFRYQTVSDSLACFLKGVKTISTLNGAFVLLRKGYAQEVGALCRMIDDYCNEIFFLLVPEGETITEDQLLFLEDFFQEEFDRTGDPLGSNQKRRNVPVKKIHAKFGKLAKGKLNPSDAQELLRTTHQAFSGYVHGAYPHIMELYGGNPPRFHMAGMEGTPRIDEWRGQLIGYVYRTLMTSVFVARKLALPQTEKAIRALLVKFEQTVSCAPTEKADLMIRKHKIKTKKKI